jgi:hypothetical protein
MAGQRRPRAHERAVRVGHSALEAQLERVGAGARQLELRDLRTLFDHRLHGQRQHRHGAAVGHAQQQRVTGAAVHVDDRERGSTRAALAGETHGIVKAVAQQRLHMVGQMRQQHRMGRATRRHRAHLPIHRLEPANDNGIKRRRCAPSCLGDPLRAPIHRCAVDVAITGDRRCSKAWAYSRRLATAADSESG